MHTFTLNFVFRLSFNFGKTWQGAILDYVAPIKFQWVEENVMAKANSIQIKLVSSAETGFYYITRKNPRTLTDKVEMRKYDPVVRKHVMFKEAKIK